MTLSMGYVVIYQKLAHDPKLGNKAKKRKNDLLQLQADIDKLIGKAHRWKMMDIIRAKLGHRK